MPKKQDKKTVTPLRTIIVLIVVGVLLGFLLLLAIQSARPGEWLYRLKRATESLQQDMAGSAQARTVTALSQANERIREIQYLYSTLPTAASPNQTSGTTVIVIQPTPLPAVTTTPAPSTTVNPTPQTTPPVNEGPMLFRSSLLEPLVGVVDEAGELITTLTTPNQWQWLTGDEGVLDNTLETVNGLTRGVLGRDIYVSPHTPAEVAQQTQGLLAEYNVHMEEMITAYQQLLTQSVTEEELAEAQHYAYLIGERLLTHRGILERLSVDVVALPVQAVLNDSLVHIDKNNKLVFQVLPEVQRNEIIKQVQLLNPDVNAHVQKIIDNTQVVGDVKVIEGNVAPNLNLDLVSLPPLLNNNQVNPDLSQLRVIDLNAGSVGVDLEGVTGLQLKELVKLDAAGNLLLNNQLTTEVKEIRQEIQQPVNMLENVPIINKLDLKVIK